MHNWQSRKRNKIEAVRKEKEALLLKQEADEDDIAERMKDFEENMSVAEKQRIS